MDRNNFLSDMDKLKSFSDNIDHHIDSFKPIFSDVFDSPLFDSFYRLFEFTAEQIALKYQIEPNALSWFIYEDEWGANGYSCSKEGVEDYAIFNASDFWNFEKGEV